uniref:small monomeric GTPase n=1 Tax=Strongyloides stercoralis TaxID=6248 RepID=A0A0K0DSK6_STRER
MSGNLIDGTYTGLTPIIKTPISDAFNVAFSQQGRVCGFFEAQFYKCVEAYGAKLGRRYCDLEHRDLKECVTGDKQNKRVEAIRNERWKKYLEGKGSLQKFHNIISTTFMDHPESQDTTRRYDGRNCYAGYLWDIRLKSYNVGIRNVMRRAEVMRCKPGTYEIFHRRKFFHSICPDQCLATNLPLGSVIQKFSVCGRYLFLTNADYSQFIVYDYIGCDNIFNGTSQRPFDKIFRLRHTYNFIKPGYENVRLQLIRSIILNSPGGKFIILASVRAYTHMDHGNFTYYRTNDSYIESKFFDVFTIYTIDIEKNVIADEYSFIQERIKQLPISVFNCTIAALALSSQVIHILHVDKETGKLTLLLKLGRDIYQDDHVYIGPEMHKREKFITGLKQKVLAHVVTKISPNCLQKLMGQLEVYKTMQLHSVQVISEHELFIKFTCNDLATSYSQKNNCNCAPLHVIYNWVTCEVLKSIKNDVPGLNKTLIDNYVATHHTCNTPTNFMDGPLHSFYPTQDFTLIIKDEGLCIPIINSFCCSRSPYLDYETFRLDCCRKSAFSQDAARLKIDVDFLKFYDLVTKGRHKVVRNRNDTNRDNFPAIYLFHPTDPFFIIVDAEEKRRDGRGCGKSALTVRYITKRFIGEYDPELEDTYCKQESILSQPIMVWLMDTVDGYGKDSMRYFSWADVYIVVYDITSQLSFQYAENLLRQIKSHEHSLCMRSHKTLVLGNKTDLERYRQVSHIEGEKLAKEYNVLFSETSAIEDYKKVSGVFSKLLESVIEDMKTRRSPSPRLYNSDSEVQTRVKTSTSFRGALKNVARSSTLRRSKSPGQIERQKLSFASKTKTGSKLLKLFQNSS